MNPQPQRPNEPLGRCIFPFFSDFFVSSRAPCFCSLFFCDTMLKMLLTLADDSNAHPLVAVLFLTPVLLRVVSGLGVVCAHDML